MYYADRLPAELIAPRVGSVQYIDLSRIARSVGNSETLYPGDVVQVTITTGIEDESPKGSDSRIAENGFCAIPGVGPVQIAGLEITQAEDLIRSESIRRGQFINPVVTLVLTTRRSNRVTVLGAVKEPGTYDVPASQSFLLGALMQAKGLTEDAGTIIEIRHPPGVTAAPPGATGPGTQLAGYPGSAAPPGSAQTLRIDLEQAAAQGGGDYRLYDGSTVMVMNKPERFVHVIGLVKKADQYEIPDDSELTLLQAIAMAGGLQLELADKVHVIRMDPNLRKPVRIEASIRRAKSDGVSDIRLAAGDVVSVEETATTFIIGTIRDFVRFGFTSGVPGL